MFLDEQDTLFIFPSKYIEKVHLNVPALKINRPLKEQMRKVQRRKFVRVHCVLDVSIHCPKDSFKPFKTSTIDISGGGMKMIFDQDIPLQKNQLIHLLFTLPFNISEPKQIETEAKVIRFGEDKDKRRTFAVAYTGLTYEEEQQIVQFCFEKQREKRLSI